MRALLTVIFSDSFHGHSVYHVSFFFVDLCLLYCVYYWYSTCVLLSLYFLVVLLTFGSALLEVPASFANSHSKAFLKVGDKTNILTLQETLILETGIDCVLHRNKIYSY